MGNNLKEFISHSLTHDEKLKEVWIIFIRKQFGAMARFLHKLFEEQEEIVKKAFLPDVKHLEGNKQTLDLVEGYIKLELLDRIKNEFCACK